MVEGNEETGSPKLPDFVKEYKDKLEADFALISDGEVLDGDPAFEMGFRGGINFTLTVKTLDTDLHSGIYGSAVPSSSTVLSDLLANLHDENNRVTIDGFYDDVDEITDQQLENSSKIPLDLEEFKKNTGTDSILTEKEEYNFFIQKGLRPAVIITGINSGYTGEGYRNSIPAVSTAKINFRLVKSQNPRDIVKKFKKFLQEKLPEYADYSLDYTEPYEGVKLDVDNRYIKEATEAIETAYGKEPIMKYSGGGLPIVTLFDEVLDIPQVLVGLANTDCNMHAPNENFDLDHLKKGLKFSREFFEK
jgi:acetylornithine deacetylase/succinyl-diaminopimelate desuccinylase-like protein